MSVKRLNKFSSVAEMNFTCFSCGQCFILLKDVNKHLKDFHMLKDKSPMKCVKIQRDNLYCDSKFHSFQALTTHIASGKCSLLSKVTQNKSHDSYKDIHSFFDDLKSATNNLNHKKATEIIDLTSSLVVEVHKLVLSELEKFDKIDCRTVLISVNDYVMTKMKSGSTRHRREKEIDHAI